MHKPDRILPFKKIEKTIFTSKTSETDHHFSLHQSIFWIKTNIVVEKFILGQLCIKSKILKVIHKTQYNIQNDSKIQQEGLPTFSKDLTTFKSLTLQGLFLTTIKTIPIPQQKFKIIVKILTIIVINLSNNNLKL